MAVQRSARGARRGAEHRHSAAAARLLSSASRPMVRKSVARRLTNLYLRKLEDFFTTSQITALLTVAADIFFWLAKNRKFV